MNFTKLTQKGIYILSIAPQEEIVQSIEKFVKKKQIRSGFILGLGAVKSVKLGHYSVKTKKYTEKKLKKPLEMTNITGIITVNKVHLHATFANQMFKSYAGHLVGATVSAACEIVLIATKEPIEREFNQNIGLELLKL